MQEKVVLIGAGSALFTAALVADIVDRGWEGELGLVDTGTDALAIAEGLAKKIVAAKGSSLTVTASGNRRDVLPGATVVITTIGVGGRRAWEKDVFIPRKYGIYQSVGDSVMPGGTSRALRMVPPMVDIANDVVRLAWLETIVEAALEGSRRKFVQALVIGGSINDLAVAEKMADELLAAHAEYLPQFAANS